MSGHEDFELGTDGSKMIVVGLDGSRTSCRVVRQRPDRQRSRVTVVYVVSLGALASMTTNAAAAADMREEIGAGLREQVERLGAERGIDAEFLVVRADPFTELRRVAQQVRANALAAEASERAGHRFAARLAGHLVKAARWP